MTRCEKLIAENPEFKNCVNVKTSHDLDYRHCEELITRSNGAPCLCSDIECSACDFRTDSDCIPAIVEWLTEEVQ